MGFGAGYDFSWDVAYLTGTKTPAVTLNLWYPLKGRTAEESGIVILGRDCTKWTWPEDGTQQAIEVTETGSGTGGVVPETAVSNVPGYPLLQKALSRTQITTSELLAKIALGDIALFEYPTVTPSIVMPVPLPGTPAAAQCNLALGEFDVGDRFTFRIDPESGGINTDPRFPGRDELRTADQPVDRHACRQRPLHRPDRRNAPSARLRARPGPAPLMPSPAETPPAHSAFAALLASLGQRLTNIETWIRSSGAMPSSTLAVAYRKAALSLGAAAFTAIPLDTVLVDNAGAMSGGNYVAPSTGWYSITGQVAATYGAAGTICIASVFISGGAEILRGTRQSSAALNELVNNQVAGTAMLETGQALELVGYNSAATTAALEVPNAAENILSVYRIA